MLNKTLAGEAKQHMPLLLLLVGLGLGGGLLAVLQASYITKIVNGVFLAEQNLAGVHVWLAFLLGIIISKAAFVWAAELAAHRLAAQVKTAVRQRLITHLLAVGPVGIVQEQTGDLVNLLADGPENLEPYFARYLPQLAAAVLVPLLILLVVFPLDMTSAFILLVTAPLIPLFMILIGRWAQQLSRQQWEQLSRLSGHFLDVLQGLTTLKIFNRSQEQAAVIARMSGQFRDTTLNVLRVAFLSALVLELLSTISTALVAVTVGLKLLYSKLTFSQGFFILLLAPEFYLPLRHLGSHFHAGMAGTAAAEQIYKVLSIPLPQSQKEEWLDLPIPREIGIAFEAVSFAYADGARPALRGVSFTVLPGEIVALVGPSGSGKSTVANLLLKFCSSDSGVITVNGVQLDRLEKSAWLRQVAYVPQSPHLFYGTVADNIRLGEHDASLATVIAAAKQAEAHELITNLPDGYETIVGEGGRSLSGGERQRLALARAFLTDAPLLILDEPTTALDPQTEAAIAGAIERLVVGRTVLVIAHRLTTVYRADRIIVLNDGHVAETGRHSELLHKQGSYYKMVTAFRGEV